MWKLKKAYKHKEGGLITRLHGISHVYVCHYNEVHHFIDLTFNVIGTKEYKIIRIKDELLPFESDADQLKVNEAMRAVLVS